MTGIADILERRIPQLRASVARVYGEDAKLFGIELSPARFAELGAALGAGPYDGTAAIMLDGLKIEAGHTLEPEKINVAVTVPEGLLVRPAALEVP